MNPKVQLLLLKTLAGFFFLQAALSGGEVIVCESRRAGQCESAWGAARMAIGGAITTLLAYMVPREDQPPGGPPGGTGGNSKMSDALRKLRGEDREG